MAYTLKLQKGDEVIVFEEGKWIEGKIVGPYNSVDWVGIELNQQYGYRHCIFINSPKFNLTSYSKCKRIVIKKVS